MNRREFMQSLLSLAAFGTLSSFKNFTDRLPSQSKKLPVIFTSHGNPFDIIKSREERAFWKKLYELGIELQKNYEIKAALVVSAHWCTRGTYVNVSPYPKQIYDYYGFPEEYYKVVYKAKGSPEYAYEVKKLVPEVRETTEWGLDHGAWPMLMHLFPEGNIPVFQMSIHYYAPPQYHYNLAKQLKSLREKGLLIIGSGALIHNLQLAGRKLYANDMTPYGWELEYDEWIKKQIESRNIETILNYERSHPLGKLAAPTPDHFVPVLYTLGLIDYKDELQFFYEGPPTLPAFSERSFIFSQ